MGPDAEEGLAHDDKRQDVEDKVGGQIMEIQPVVEHEPADKWVERKSQSADEMGKKNYPLMGFGLGVGRKTDEPNTEPKPRPNKLNFWFFKLIQTISVFSSNNRTKFGLFGCFLG